MNSTMQWLEWLFGAKTDGLIWIGGHRDGWRGRTFVSCEHAARYAERLDTEGGQGEGVYFRLTPMRPVTGGRGTAADSAAVVAFGADLDLAGPGHKEAKLPRPDSPAQLLAILREAGVPEPSAWVHSGGGRYAFWKLDKPCLELADAQQVSAALHQRIIATAALMGYKIDNTRDLARVYRLPGTHNRKSDPPVRAEILSIDGPEYTFAQMHDALLSFPSSAEEKDTSENGKLLPVGSGTSSLFSGGQGEGGVRQSVSYTLADAMKFVAPALDRLRSAQDGEINSRLNDAAMALAHFGETFWSREAAEKQLYAALEHTVYDGRTWQAGDTIESAYKAMAARSAAGDPECWSAELLPEWTAGPGGVIHPDDVSVLLGEMLTADDLAAREPPRFMIEDLLQFDSEAWVIGEPGSKKSFVVLDMAAHVATGRSWQGKRVNPALVVFIVAEGAGGSAARVRAWQQEYGVMGEYIRFLPRPVQSADLGAWAVLVQACARLAGVAAQQGRGMFVVLDTQARVTVGLKENDATDMGIFVSALGAIRAATGACVLPIHHTGRRGGDARGSSAIDGAQTTELKVVKVRDMYGKLIVEKQKDIAEIDPIKIKFKVVDLGQDADGKAVSSLVLVPADAWNRAEFDDETLERAKAEQQRDVNPFAVRSAPESWTHRLAPNAEIDRWLLQALADVAQQQGLTKSEWLNQVAKKRYDGKTYSQSGANWEKNFQRVTDATEPAGVTGVVVKIEGTARWTVDQIALSALRNPDEDGQNGKLI